MHDLSRRVCQFLLSACTGCVGDSSSLERWQLQLSEVFAEVVPSDMPVVGGTLVGEEFVVLRFPTGIAVLSRATRVWSRPCPETLAASIGISATATPGVVEALLPSGFVVTVNLRTGACSRTESAGVDWDALPTEAVKVAGSWRVRTTRDNGDRPDSPANDGAQTRIRVIASPDARQDLHWTVGRRGLTITALVYPFEWRDSGSTGVVVGHPFDSDTSVSFEAKTVAARTLRSLSAQRLDHGYLQTLSDPTSDLRLLVVYDDLGRRVSAATIEAPLGIVGTSPPRHELLAVRTLGAAEVAIYRWQWKRPSDP